MPCGASKRWRRTEWLFHRTTMETTTTAPPILPPRREAAAAERHWRSSDELSNCAASTSAKPASRLLPLITTAPLVTIIKVRHRRLCRCCPTQRCGIACSTRPSRLLLTRTNTLLQRPMMTIGAGMGMLMPMMTGTLTELTRGAFHPASWRAPSTTRTPVASSYMCGGLSARCCGRCACRSSLTLTHVWATPAHQRRRSGRCCRAGTERTTRCC